MRLQLSLKKPSPTFEVDICDVHNVLSLKKLQEYDAVMTWWGTQNYPVNVIGNVLADYADSGGAVVCATFSTNAGSGLTGRFADEHYWCFVPGEQSGGNFTMTFPTDKKLLRHPLLNHVKSFVGGSYSYLSNITPKSDSTVISSWSNGTPLVIEGPLGGKKKHGRCRTVCLNFYPVSSRSGAGNWDISSDGGHLMLNSLIYVASHSHLKRLKSTGKPSSTGSTGPPLVDEVEPVDPVTDY